MMIIYDDEVDVLSDSVYISKWLKKIKWRGWPQCEWYRIALCEATQFLSSHFLLTAPIQEFLMILLWIITIRFCVVCALLLLLLLLFVDVQGLHAKGYCDDTGGASSVMSTVVYGYILIQNEIVSDFYHFKWHGSNRQTGFFRCTSSRRCT